MSENVDVVVCAFGSPWGRRGCGPCRKCRAESRRMDRAFARSVFFGEYDANGYTPAEAQARETRDRKAVA